MNRSEARVGTRVRSLRAFVSVPEGTEGVIDHPYDGGVMVAWDLPDRPLPANYREWDGRPAAAPGVPLRDGFGYDEFEYLGVVAHADQEEWTTPLSLQRRP